MCHALDAESCKLCAIEPTRARYLADLSPHPTGCQLALAFGLRLCGGGFWHRERSGRAEFFGASQWPFTDAVQQIGLRRFQRDQPAENVQQIEQVGGIFWQPPFGLQAVEWRRWKLVTNDRLGSVAPTIAEPVLEDAFAGDFIGPHLGRDVFNVALADD
jgi:hypothetical protein